MMNKFLLIFFLSISFANAGGIATRQQAPMPIQKQLILEQKSECQLRKEYYTNKVTEHPQSPYYKFMLKIWTDRCKTEEELK